MERHVHAGRLNPRRSRRFWGMGLQVVTTDDPRLGEGVREAS